MVNHAFRIKIAYRSEKKKEEEEENTRDRSVPDGSDNKVPFTSTSLRIPDEYSPPVRPHPIKGKITATINESHCHCDRHCLDLVKCVEV